jgi:LysR family transcriptional activator of nhaA
MDWLNYHHLRYFWTVAKQGSLKAAAEQLHVSQPSISEQIRELEAALGEKLFRRSGRTNVLTDAGQMVFGYAEEIFALGRELVSALKQRPGAHALRLYVGVADSFPKLVTNEILKPVFQMPQPVHVICREGKLDDLLAQLTAHRLDIVLADEPASTSHQARLYNHRLQETSVAFCAVPKLAAKLSAGFPKSLNGAPALLPTENTSLRRAVEQWFRAQDISPRIVAEFEDLALMKVMALEGRGFLVVPSLVVNEAVGRYKFRVIGQAAECNITLYAITGERRIHHPAVALITGAAAEASAVQTFGPSGDSSQRIRGAKPGGA